MKTKTKTIVGIFILLLSAALAVSVYQVWSNHSQQKKDKDDFTELQEICEIAKPTQTTPETAENPAENSESDALRHDVSQLRKINSDCIAWISIPDTEISYPVMHSPTEPQRYLRQNFYREYSISGVPFLDYRCTSDSANLVVYGHHMKNGTMFADLISYTDKSFCEKHPTIQWETETEIRYYTIYAVAAVSKTDSWYSFIDADTEDEFKEQIASLKSKALYVTDNEPMYGEQLLTLSTCYGSGDDGRLIVIGAERLINAFDESVDCREKPEYTVAED